MDAAASTTAGTNAPASLSAAAWIGAFDSCASSTSRAICAIAARPPTAVAFTSRVPPPRLTVPPKTDEPGLFDTGAGSPVSIDSSTYELPATTTPSAGRRAPGTVFRMSPLWTSSAGSSVSLAMPPLSRSPSAPFSPSGPASRVTSRALRGASDSSAATAAPVLPLAPASSHFPKRMNDSSIAAVSKKSVGT